MVQKTAKNIPINESEIKSSTYNGLLTLAILTGVMMYFSFMLEIPVTSFTKICTDQSAKLNQAPIMISIAIPSLVVAFYYDIKLVDYVKSFNKSHNSGKLQKSFLKESRN